VRAVANPKQANAVVEFGDCYLKHAFTVDPNSGGRGRRLRVKILRVQEKDGRLQVWASVRGPKSLFRVLQRRLASLKGSSYIVMNNAPDSRLVYVTLPAVHCDIHDRCPLATPNARAFVQVAMVQDGRMLAVVVASSRKSLLELERAGFRVLEVVELEEYTELTPSQEEILLLAYEEGYYSYPRRTSLRELARKAGLSVSALAERLRKAEAKVIRKVILEEIELSKHFSRDGRKSVGVDGG